MEYIINTYPRSGSTFLLWLLNRALDKPHQREHVPFAIKGIFKDTKQIVIARDPIKSTASYMLAQYQVEVDFNLLIENADGYFNFYNLFLEYAIDNPETTMLVKFDSIANNPIDTVEKICGVRLSEEDIVDVMDALRKNRSSDILDYTRKNFLPGEKAAQYYDVIDYLNSYSSPSLDRSKYLYDYVCTLKTTI